MKQTVIKTILIALLPILWVACGDDDNNPDINNSGGLKISVDAKNNEISGKGGGLFLRIETNSEWTASVQDSWCTLQRSSGTGTSSVMCAVTANTGKQRSTIITVKSGKEVQEITLTQKEDNGDMPDPDPDPDPDRPSGYAGRIEIPKLLGGDMNQFITHSTKRNGKDYPTYSMEYSYAYKHCYWIAYRFDNTTEGNVGRNENYVPDPNIPVKYQTYKSDYSFATNGYTRGHICASSDRQYSVDANKQTFYMSNISPQQQTGFNQSGSAWNNAEDNVQKWGGISQSTDTLYVIKGGTIGPNKIKGYIDNGIAIPKHFFMAVLYYSNKKYKAIAFYMPHENLNLLPQGKDPKNYILSVDKLEEETGFNFFHNLPNNIETEVEANYNTNDWKW